MMKSLLAANRSEKDSFRIPHSVQQSIPIRRIYTDGIWQVGQKYSKTWRFSDINYAASSLDDRRSIFRSYGAVLNSLPTDATAKITIINRRLNPVDFQRTMLMPECSDGLDYYRGEYNQIILDKAAESNNLVQEKYITLSIGLRKIEQTRAYFRRVDTNLSASFGRLDSGAYAISCADRLRLLHDFFRPGEEASFRFDLSANIKRGIDFRDLICPDGLQFRAGYFEMGSKFGRVLFMRDYASFISDEMIKDLSDFSRNLLLSIDILPIPTEEAVREVQSRILGVETDITRWQQRQNRQNNFTATVPYDLEQMRTESKDLLEDLTARDQRLMFACVTLVHIADSLEQLDADTQTLQSIAQEKLCGFSVLRYQQEDGLNTVLPYGLRRIHALRTLTTESCAVLMPFRAQEIQDPGGLYYGVNAISKNLLICDRKRLISPHAFYLGVSGSGKSVAMKNSIANVALSTNDDIIICDPEAEYYPLVRRLHGQVIRISPTSTQYVNPMDINLNYSEDDSPLALKSDFILSLCELVIGGKEGLQPVDKTVIDRAVRNVYRPFLADPDPEKMPILGDLYNELLKQPEPEAARIAAALELYVSGSLNVFNHRTNVELNNRLVCFDIKQLGKQLKKLGMLIVQDQVWNRVTVNRAERKSTRYFMDEFHLLLKEEQTAAYSVEIWKRFRKWGGIPTAITQNVKDLLASREVENIFENSDFVLMLNQAAGDRAILAKQLNISPQQMKYVTHTEAGEGLIFYGNVVLPFVDRFPKDTELYRVMTTKPEEVGEA